MIDVSGAFDPDVRQAGHPIPAVGGRPIFAAGAYPGSPNKGYDPRSPKFSSEFSGVSTYFEKGELPDLMNYGKVERTRSEYAKRVADQFRAFAKLKFFTGGGTMTQRNNTGIETNGQEINGVSKFDPKTFRNAAKRACCDLFSSGPQYNRL